MSNPYRHPISTPVAELQGVASIASAQATPSPAPMVEQAGEVIQADREMAASLFHMIIGGVGGAKKMRAGEIDHHSVVQAFARHRLNTRPAPAETEGVSERETTIPEGDDEGPCTDCWGTGITTQTERRCSCGAGEPAPKASATPEDGEGEKLTMTIHLTQREQEALERLMAEQQLSGPQVFKCALREYQMGHERRKSGETVQWSGDAQRLREFAGSAISALPVEGADEDVADAGTAELRWSDQTIGGWLRSRGVRQGHADHLAAFMDAASPMAAEDIRRGTSEHWWVPPCLIAISNLHSYASTPPADAGMLREALEYVLPLLRANRETFFDCHTIDRDPRSLTDEEAIVVAGYDAAINAAETALNSQAHQIREGDHD